MQKRGAAEAKLSLLVRKFEVFSRKRQVFQEESLSLEGQQITVTIIASYQSKLLALLKILRCAILHCVISTLRLKKKGMLALGFRS